jgi:hypothetical protein
MTPERVLEHAEKVREAHRTERKLKRLAPKVERHPNLAPFRDKVAERLSMLRGAA